MEGFIFKYLSLSGVFFILCCILKVFHVIWWKPKSLEKHLKKLGIRGNSYTLMYGDMKETKKLIAEAWSKPMPLNHAIVHRVNPLWHQMFHKYGKISLTWLQRRPRLIIADPELTRLILNDKNGHFQKPPANPLVNLLTLGVNTLEGEKWAKRRKLITPAFHHEKLQEMLPAFLTSFCNLIDQWKNLVGSKGSSELDVAQEMQNLAADVISRAAFGSSFEDGKTIFELQKEQAGLVLEAFMSIYLPGYRFLPTKKNRRRYEIDNKIKAMLKEMIQRKERAMQKGESKNGDLLSLLLQCKSHTNNDMKIEDVIEECKLFYFAGQETTANWLTWTIIVLSMHPDWQEKARQEVLQICGKKTPDLKDINQLRIVSMVLQEVFRLYPPVTGLNHERWTSKSDLA
ncbi:unnamed protein product [Fraxinus pennsylvanica]|uniref:Cytochrome P450 n=1 Tax=Fraxinus pennsylvanica TaxID=56036 RepID=A0AAD2E5G5_9LAMI|nr:unnamed protein product [Fraxinus pennsylvanica]